MDAPLHSQAAATHDGIPALSPEAQARMTTYLLEANREAKGLAESLEEIKGKLDRPEFHYDDGFPIGEIAWFWENSSHAQRRLEEGDLPRFLRALLPVLSVLGRGFVRSLEEEAER